MTLCGVLKDILLVLASMAIWGTPVTPLQFFGYSIALGGMVYFKLGADNLKVYFGEASRRWAEFGAARPAQRKLVLFAAVLIGVFLLAGAVAPSMGYDPRQMAGQGAQYFKGTGYLPSMKTP